LSIRSPRSSGLLTSSLLERLPAWLVNRFERRRSSTALSTFRPRPGSRALQLHAVESSPSCCRHRSTGSIGDGANAGNARQPECRAALLSADLASATEDRPAEDRKLRQTPPGRCRLARRPGPSVARATCRCATPQRAVRHGLPPRAPLARLEPLQPVTAASGCRRQDPRPPRGGPGIVSKFRAEGSRARAPSMTSVRFLAG
jgi:hypothetical protein